MCLNPYFVLNSSNCSDNDNDNDNVYHCQLLVPSEFPILQILTSAFGGQLGLLSQLGLRLN